LDIEEHQVKFPELLVGDLAKSLNIKGGLILLGIYLDEGFKECKQLQ
jgi:hypothetical protein